MKKKFFVLFLFLTVPLLSQENCSESDYFHEHIVCSIVKCQSVNKFIDSCEFVVILTNTGDKTFYLGDIVLYAISLESEIAVGKSTFFVGSFIEPQEKLVVSQYISSQDFEYSQRMIDKKFLWHPDYSSCYVK